MSISSRLCLILCSPFALCAAPIVITVSGDFPTAVVGSAWPYTAQHFLLTFAADQTPSGVMPVSGGGAFTIPVQIAYSSGSFTQKDSGTAGWFEYTTGPLAGANGLDIRFAVQDGSFLQTITHLANPPYTGSDSNPVLVLTGNVSGPVSSFYYAPNSNTPAVSTTAADGQYSTGNSVTPEPRSATLVLAGISCVALRLLPSALRRLTCRSRLAV